MRRAERLFRIVALFRERRSWTATLLAAELEVCERTVYRDIAHLQGSGVAIDGAAGIGYLADTRLSLPPLNFTCGQLEALALGASFVMSAADSDLARSAREAQQKIAAVLPQGWRDGLRQAPLSTVRRAPARAPEIAAKLRHAIRKRHIVELAYGDRSSRITHRRVRPLLLTAFTDSWSLGAWCEKRRALRSFRLDRILSLRATDEPFDDPPNVDIKRYLRAARALMG
jgi:predicted DNA-binding transcriptional regulator YafY